MENPDNLTKVAFPNHILHNGFEIGDYSYGVPKLRYAKQGTRLVIGKFCSIADRVEIFLSGNHRIDLLTTYPFIDFPEIWGPPTANSDNTQVPLGVVSIGHDVWIGSGAKILPGVTIGSGAVLGAFSVISKDVPPYAMVVGNPMRVVKYRFPEAIRMQLLASEWWHLPDHHINALAPLIQSNDIAAFLEAVATLKSAPR